MSTDDDFKWYEHIIFWAITILAIVGLFLGGAWVWEKSSALYTYVREGLEPVNAQDRWMTYSESNPFRVTGSGSKALRKRCWLTFYRDYEIEETIQIGCAPEYDE